MAEDLLTSSTSKSPGTAFDRTANIRVGCFGNSSRKAVSKELANDPKKALSVQS
jgi:hypothetical protein